MTTELIVEMGIILEVTRHDLRLQKDIFVVA
jgi:hypothetical protein